MTEVIQVAAPPPKPLLVFDGDCSFCRRWIHRWQQSTGDRVEYLPLQDDRVADQFPELTRERLEVAVHLVETDGRVYRAAEAVFRSLGYGPLKRWPLWLYQQVPAVAPVTEWAYRLVAAHRSAFSTLTTLFWGDHIDRPSYHLVRWTFLRGLGVIYLIAFEFAFGDRFPRDFFAPVRLLPSLARERPPSTTMLWLIRWLLFRLMFASGCVKLLSGDRTWRDLTALNFHYETQPLPTWPAWYLQQLPEWSQKTSVVLMFEIELVVPFFIFLPRRLRLFGCGAMILFQVIVEGSNDGQTWLAYEFNDKPGDLKWRPRFIAPHQPRLDWQMWFAALGTYRENPWFINFCVRLLQSSPEVLALLKHNPFPNAPPKHIRAVVYQYHFTDSQTRRREGTWWRREFRGNYCPVLTLR